MRIGIACLYAVAAGLATPLAATPATVPLTTVLPLDPGANEYPEGIAIDKRGNIYVGLVFDGRILRLGPDGSRSTLTTLPIGGGFLVRPRCHRSRQRLCGTCLVRPGDTRVWRISPEGASERIAALDPAGFPNGLAFDERGDLFVSDSFLATIWRLGQGGGTAEAWLQSPLLAGDPVSGFGVGANGLAFWRGDLYVANTDLGSIVRVPVQPDGTAGAAEIYVADPAIAFADGIAFDVRGSLYVVNSLLSNTLVRIASDRTLETLATAADGLDYPASVAFGTGRSERTQLYTTSASTSACRA